MVIPFSKVVCDGNELKYLGEVLASGWLTTASKTFAFEKAFGERVGAAHACAVNSATAALHLGMEALGVGPGSKVFVPTMTFTATAEVIRYLGGDPVFLDVEYGSNLLTPAILEEAIARYPDVKYLAVVHYGGQAAPMREASGTDINTICRRNDIRIIEDAAHAFPSMCGGTMVGALGNVTCFSFYANKTITTGEGGMLTTDDEAVLKRVKVMRLHGINRDIWNRYTSSVPGWEYDVVAPGYKYNMPDTAAAIGLAQLERADEYRRGRERCAAYYYKHLGGVGSIDLPLVHGAMHEHSWHIYHIVLNEKAKILRNDLIDRLSAAGIGTSVHYKPLHRMTYYQERYGLKAEDFPNAERMWQGSVSLPIYPTLGEVELEYICTTVRTLLG